MASFLASHGTREDVAKYVRDARLYVGIGPDDDVLGALVSWMEQDKR